MATAIKIDCNVDIPMPDGVTRRADTYRPDDTARHPVLLARLPEPTSACSTWDCATTNDSLLPGATRSREYGDSGEILSVS